MEKANQEIADILAGQVARISYDELSDDMRQVTKKVILDTLGVMLAGSSMGEGCRQVAALVIKGGGKKESTVIGYGNKVPSWMAAFANGAMAHALDYDDQMHEARLHAGVTTVPAALAAAEAAGKVSGKEFLTATALANELICRLGLCLYRRTGGFKTDWSSTCVFGRFSATAAAGRLLGLSQKELAEAFGIAFAQAAGTFLVASSPSAVRGLHAGFADMAGVLSALMAKEGITGVRPLFEGKAGLFDVYFPGGFDRPTLLGDWRTGFEGVQMTFKPWPCCRFSHSYVDATLHMKSQFGIAPGDVESITLSVGEITQALCDPIARRRKPQGTAEAKFSLPYIVASAFTRGSPVIEHFTPDGLQDPSTLGLAEKVSYRFEQEVNSFATPPGIVEIKTRNGGSHREKVEIAYGHPDKPLSTEVLRQKFIDCAKYAARPLPKGNAEKIADMVDHLEKVADMAELTALLTPEK